MIDRSGTPFGRIQRANPVENHWNRDWNLMSVLMAVSMAVAADSAPIECEGSHRAIECVHSRRAAISRSGTPCSKQPVVGAVRGGYSELL